MVEQELIESVMKVKRVSQRILSMDMVLQVKIVTIILVYGPPSRSKEEKKSFMILWWKRNQEKYFVLEDFNGYVRRSTYEYDGNS